MRRFPDDQILADYASGALPRGMSLLVASHLTFRPESRRRVAELESLGGALLAENAALTPPPLADALERIDAAPQAEPPPLRPRADAASPFPAPLQEVIGARPEALDWKFRLPGVSECMVEGFEDEEVSLLRARPGAPLLSHTHTGREATLILTGEMQDRGQIYRRGDVSFADEHDDHRPRIVGTETCICLVVMTGNLRFTGAFSRVLNLLGE